MSDYTLSVPEDIYSRARRIADESAQPIDQVLLDQLRMLPSLPILPAEEEAELAALRHLSDDALWTIAREQLPSDIHTQMETLMDKNSLGKITADEYAVLSSLVDRSQRLMLRKSEAAALLTQRGYHVKPQDMAGRE